MISVEVLKKKILDKAIRGELVESNPSEKAVDIEAIKDNVPFEIPSNWRWCYLKQVSSINIGKTPPTKERKYWGTGIKWISIYDMKHRGIIKETKKEITFEALNDIYINKLIAPGTLIMSFKLTIGKLSILEDSCVHNEAIANFDVYEQKIEKHYLMNVLDALNLEETTKNAVKGKTLNKKTLNLIKLPLPPLEEQKRIGAKIEELFKLIDKKEKNDATLNSYKEKLKDKILDEAIRGKLVEQDLNEEPIDIEEIKENVPFEIPSNWKWLELAKTGVIQTGTTPDTTRREYFNGNIPFIKPGDINNGKINYCNESLTELGLSKSREIPKDSVMMVCIGGSTGKCAINTRICSCNQQINTLTAYNNISHKYIYYVMISNYFYNRLLNISTGTATPLVNKTRWSKMVIPIPPIEEQKRIVAKIEELFNFFDKIHC